MARRGQLKRGIDELLDNYTPRAIAETMAEVCFEQAHDIYEIDEEASMRWELDGSVLEEAADKMFGA